MFKILPKPEPVLPPISEVQALVDDSVARHNHNLTYKHMAATWKCSRCGSRTPNPSCYVCFEPREETEREAYENGLADYLLDEMEDRRLHVEDEIPNQNEE